MFKKPTKKKVQIQENEQKKTPERIAEDTEIELQVRTIKEKPPEEFAFNVMRNGREHYLEFKQTVIEKVKNSADINLEAIKQIAASTIKQKQYYNEGFMLVDQRLTETQLIKDVIGTHMVNNRRKLLPFTNRGFNYKDRRKQTHKSTADPGVEKERQLSFIAHRHVIDKFKRKLEDAIYTKNPFKIEKILTEIHTFPDERA